MAPAKPPENASRPARVQVHLDQRGLTRREALRLGFWGSLALWGGGAVASALPGHALGAEVAPALRFFRTKDVPMVRAVTAALLDWALPKDAAAREDALRQSIAAADRYFSSFTPAVQDQARQAFDLLGLPPVRWLGGLWRSWEVASPEEVNRYLEGLRTSRLGLFRQIQKLLNGVAVVGWYSLPASWAGIGYPGPPTVTRPSGERPV